MIITPLIDPIPINDQQGTNSGRSNNVLGIMDRRWHNKVTTTFQKASANNSTKYLRGSIYVKVTTWPK